ncbi:hypothetical protein ACFXKC_51370 [Streptomyces sp. NPDC059340]|uniref:hypothetical protein n=1 Tax=Streptomyces sp. NPDC059340 TaxID=3346806 RepID=UPI0036A61367
MLQCENTQYAHIRIDPTRIGLTAGIDVHRLTITAELLPSGVEHSSMLCEAEAELYVSSPSGRWLATAKPMRIRLTNHNHTALQLAFPLANQQLLVLEEHRAGQDLSMERILAVTDWPAISKNDDLFQRNQAQRCRAITRRRSTKHRVPNTLMR